MMAIADIAVSIASHTWDIVEDSAVFILAGFWLAGVIKIFMPIDMVKRLLGANGLGSVAKASLLGIPLPLCSCSVIPVAVSLRQQGAGKGATTAFLISTPETGPDSISVTYALLDPVMTLFRPVAAFVTAFTAGALETFFGEKDGGAEHGEACSPACCSQTCVAEEQSGKAPRGAIAETFHYAFVELMDDLAAWLSALTADAGA